MTNSHLLSIRTHTHAELYYVFYSIHSTHRDTRTCEKKKNKLYVQPIQKYTFIGVGISNIIRLLCVYVLLFIFIVGMPKAENILLKEKKKTKKHIHGK